MSELKKTISEEIHQSNLSIHLGATKMYHDLKKMFWCLGMKIHFAQFVYSCLTFQKLKIEHQKPDGLMQSLDMPKHKWDNISMDFVIGLMNTPRGFDEIWEIVDRLTKSVHFIPIKISFSLQKLLEI